MFKQIGHRIGRLSDSLSDFMTGVFTKRQQGIRHGIVCIIVCEYRRVPCRTKIGVPIGFACESDGESDVKLYV
jgi:hypothetical protein